MRHHREHRRAEHRASRLPDESRGHGAQHGDGRPHDGEGERRGLPPGAEAVLEDGVIGAGSGPRVVERGEDSCAEAEEEAGQEDEEGGELSREGGTGGDEQLERRDGFELQEVEEDDHERPLGERGPHIAEQSQSIEGLLLRSELGMGGGGELGKSDHNRGSGRGGRGGLRRGTA